MRSDGALAVAVVVVAVVVVAVNQVVPRHVLNVWVCGWLDGCLGKCVWGWVDAVREVGVGARAVVELVLLVVVVVAVVLRVVVAVAPNHPPARPSDQSPIIQPRPTHRDVD